MLRFLGSRKSSPTQVVLAVCVLASAGVAAGCGGTGSTSDPHVMPTVVATTSIWADVVANLLCDGQASVASLMPAGTDPHDYEPSLGDRGRLESAVVVVANGAGLEGRVAGTIAAVEGGGTPVVRMADLMGVDDGDDPHLWFDPIAVVDALPALADALVADAGLDRVGVDACLDAYIGQLAETDRAIAAMFEPVATDRRLIVTNHDALGRFADHYGLTVVGNVLPSSSTLAEANPADLAALVDRIAGLGVEAVFVDIGAATVDAEQVASRAGVEVVELYTGALGEAGSGADTYVGLLMVDAQRIAATLR
jgi:zinc/manganese transport system substrate-binding protein